MPSIYNNKVIWITGASSGIGEALAYAFSKENAKLVLSSTREPELERVKANCLILGSPDCMVLPLDLSNLDANELTKKVIKRFGAIDVLVNNGGVSQRSFIIETPIEIDRKIMEINYFGGVALTKGVLPFMLQNNGGHIVVVSSITGKFGFSLRSAYSASKHALQGFYEALYAELKKEKIKVTIAYPGRIRTNVSMNAITKDGNRHGIMDHGQDGGISAENCANQMIRAMKKNKVEILIGRKELIMVYIKRFFPGLFFWLVDKVKPT
jgi:dehydrogenase/reductase SDR family member 7B